MIILEDTRQQAGKHDRKHDDFTKKGIELSRCALAVGDYCLMPAVAVDTKKDIQELATDVYQDHERFRRECQKAQNGGTRLYILVENLSGIHSLEELHRWDNVKETRGRSKISPKSLQKTLLTMSRKYGVIFLFCHPYESARIIKDILTFKDKRNTNV